MKKFITSVLACAAAFGTFAQEKIGDTAKVGDTTYMFVCELKTPEENANFQRNLNIMQRDSQAVEFFKKQLAAETDAAKKADIRKKLEILEKNFGTNDSAMQKAYNFAASRKYRIVFLESNICVPLTNDELSSLKDADGNALDPMKIFKRGGRTLYTKSSVKGVRENEVLQRMIGFVITRRNEIENLRKQLAQTTDPAKQMEITTKLGAGEKALAEAEGKLRAQYAIKPKSDYVIETAKSKLYLILTPEEILKIEAQNKLQSANK